MAALAKKSVIELSARPTSTTDVTKRVTEVAWELLTELH